jgi:agmatine/peptidylarginine deiminase
MTHYFQYRNNIRYNLLKISVVTGLVCCFLTLATSPGTAQREDDTLVKKFTHQMTPEEELQRGEIGKDFISTPPPIGPVFNVAEFNRMQAVLIRYPFGISYTVIAELSEHVNVVTIVTGLSQENTVLANYIANGVNISNCSFLYAPTESYWTRDYGPWFVFDGNGQPGIVDFPYNRPSRPNDNNIPVVLSQNLGINLYGMNVIHTGGNYMTDGMGISSSSELVWDENPTLTHAQIAQDFQDYLGIGNYHVVPDPNNTYIDHIDCWGKFLDADKVLIREVPVTHAQYDEIEATAAYYASQISSYGVNYEVHRVYTPNNEPYTNSFIINNKVLVPVTGSQWDDEALLAYQEAMPGYEVLGFTGSWESTDALHCRVIGIADLGMLRINLVPLLGYQPLQTEYEIQAEITAYSNQPVYSDSVFIIYSVNFGTWDTIPMDNTSGNIYSGSIPGPVYGSQVEYYLFAADQSGRNETHPLIGLPDPHLFIAGEPLYPNITANPSNFNVTLPVDEMLEQGLNIGNTGGMLLNFNAGISYNTPASSTVQVFPVNADYNTGSTSSSAKTEISKVKGYPPNEAGWMKFDIGGIPDGAVINSVEFHGYVNANNWPYWSITPVTNDPVTTSAPILNTDIKAEASSGYYLHREETATIIPGYLVYMLAGNVNVNLQAALIQDWFAIGIVDTDAGTYYIGFDGWNEANKPYLVINYSPLPPPQNWLNLDGGSTVAGSLGGQNSQTISVGFDATGLTEGIYIAYINISSNDPDSPNISIPVTLNVISHVFVDLKIYLEGPFNGTTMNTEFTGLTDFPLTQPYQGPPWNYPDVDTVTTLPPNVVDWILVEYRDAPDAASATAATMIGRQAAFLLNDGFVVAVDGISDLQPNISVAQQLFVVIYHRNHLSVMSANPLVLAGSVYQYDFTDGEMKVYGGLEGHIQIVPGIWGMISGDCNADGIINEFDLIEVWNMESGLQGYKQADPSMNGQVDNRDKNDLIIKNISSGTQVP